jgi:hypothetical protein
MVENISLVTPFNMLIHFSVQKCSADFYTADNYQWTPSLHVSQRFVIIMMKKVYKLCTICCNG